MINFSKRDERIGVKHIVLFQGVARMWQGVDLRRFWEVNEACRDLGQDIPRVPVDMQLDGDWICDYLKLDNARYYSDYRYQQENRLRCSEITKRELAYEILPSVDFGVVMDASIYGGTVNYTLNATPTLQPVVDHPCQIDSLVEHMATIDILEVGLIPQYLQWRQNIERDYGIKLTYGGGMKGCATMLGQICGITNFLTWLLTDPGQIRKLVDCWLEMSKKYIRTLREITDYPSDRPGFALFSDVAGMLSPELYRDFLMPAERELYDLFAPYPDDKRFYHADYHMLHHLDALGEMGVNEVNIDPYIEASQILERLPKAVVYGQIPPTAVLLRGTPEDVADCIKRDIQQAGHTKQLVVCTAGSINPGTPFGNLRAMCYAVEAYGYVY